MRRNLDNIYIRVCKENICFTDLEEPDAINWLKTLSVDGLKRTKAIVSELHDFLSYTAYSEANAAEQKEVEEKTCSLTYYDGDDEKKLINEILTIRHNIRNIAEILNIVSVEE